MQPQNQYDFITNPQTQKRSPLNNLSGGSKMVKFVFGLVVLLVIIGGYSAFKAVSQGSSNKPLLIDLVARQEEIIHIASQAANATVLDTTKKGVIETANLAVSSQQQQLIAYMTTQKIEIKQKDKLKYPTGDFDARLAGSKATSTYESVLVTELNEKLDAYKTALSAAYDKTPGKNGQALLKASYAGADLADRKLAQK